jgi:hypothetical protein
MTGAAAFVRNGRLDILAVNKLGSVLYSPVLEGPDQPVNLARFIFRYGRDSGFYADRAGMSRACVGNLRAETGRNPADRALSGLIQELLARSGEFRALWAEHDVEYYRTGTQPFRHPRAGDLTLDYNAFELPGDPGQTMIVYTADPKTPSGQALARLAALAEAPSRSLRGVALVPPINAASCGRAGPGCLERAWVGPGRQHRTRAAEGEP